MKVSGSSHGLGPVSYTQLLEDMMQMGFHGAQSQGQLGGDLAIRLALGDQLQYFQLPFAKRIQ